MFLPVLCHLILVQYSCVSDISVQRYDFFLKNDAISIKKSHITRQTKILHGYYVANVLLLYKKRGKGIPLQSGNHPIGGT